MPWSWGRNRKKRDSSEGSAECPIPGIWEQTPQGWGAGGASPQHGAGGEVTSSESLSELLLPLSSSPSPCWGEERGTSITGNPGTLCCLSQSLKSERLLVLCVSRARLGTAGAAVEPRVTMAPQSPPETRARISVCAVQCPHQAASHLERKRREN